MTQTQARALPRRNWRRRAGWLAAACAVLAAAAVGLQLLDRLDPLAGDLPANAFEQVIAGD